MKPMDNSEFLAQTAQFTTVEKLSDLATAQQSLLTAQLQLGASNLIGKTVAYTDQDGKEQSGVVTRGEVLRHQPHPAGRRHGCRAQCGQGSPQPGILKGPLPYASLTLLRHQRPAGPPDR